VYQPELAFNENSVKKIVPAAATPTTFSFLLLFQSYFMGQKDDLW